MKKLNNKGFTLIELLAVIVILAIIMVVTIPTVLSSINNARTSTFTTSADTIADWVEKQYSLYALGDTNVTGNISANFTTFCNKDCTTVKTQGTVGNSGAPSGAGITSTNANAYNFLKAAGVDPKNYNSFSVLVDASTGRACVKLNASNDGVFKNVTNKYVASKAC